MNFNKLFCSLLGLIIFNAGFAQKGFRIAPKEIKNLIGCWQGTLNYNGTLIRKPHVASSGLVIKQIGSSKKFDCLNIYTKEPSENVSDTLVISNDGRKLNGVLIVSKKHTVKGVEIITEASGFDKENNKTAKFRYIYLIGRNNYTYKKVVQVSGQADWIEREEFMYVRKAC